MADKNPRFVCNGSEECAETHCHCYYEHREEMYCKTRMKCPILGKPVVCKKVKDGVK